MSIISRGPRILLPFSVLTGLASASLSAQPPQDLPEADLSASYSAPAPEAAEMTEGPEIEGIISARNGNQVQVTSADGANTVVAVTDTTRIRSSGGFLGLNRNKLASDSLLNGLPVSIKTLQ